MTDPGLLTRKVLLDYFLAAATPRADWKVGMEVEVLGRRASDGLPLPYEGEGPSVRGVLELIRSRRGGDPVLEGEHLIGLDAAWGSISLEPGGQVEWSSRPEATLQHLGVVLRKHLDVMQDATETLGVAWLDEAVDPRLPVDTMPWMPKSRYNIMRPFLGQRGRLAHRMMTQTASIQCAFDYADVEDWKRKFKAAALMAPAAIALFANSSRVDGADSGFRSYRQAIWRETDPDRCGLPAEVFDPAFDIELWLDWVTRVPTIFQHRARGRVPSGGVPFTALMERRGCDTVTFADWETHLSTIFTDVRSYTYVEVRSADLQPGMAALAVPTLWAGLLYHDDSLDGALELGRPFDDHAAWDAAVLAAARDGLDGSAVGCSLREQATEALRLALHGLRHGGACAGGADDAAPLLELAERRGLALK